MSLFDPNLPGVPNGNFFALPYTPQEAEIVLLPVPWDVTTSYREGTCHGPKAMEVASCQIDLFHPRVPRAWEIAIATLPHPQYLQLTNQIMRPKAQTIMAQWARGEDPTSAPNPLLDEINEACRQMNQWVTDQTAQWLDQGKMVGLVGGDHSVPLGYLRALGARHEAFGLLHIDAHADLRCAYEGFTYSHASIMYNALQEVPQIAALVQVGPRDYCQEEQERIAHDPRITCFPDHELQQAFFEGTPWHAQCERIIASLPQKVYLSLDIDGLDPSLCPQTGTPVPGGLTFGQLEHLLFLLVSRRTLIGFDLCEVSPGAKDYEEEDSWDANVGARVLHKLCCYTHYNKEK